MVCFQHLKRCPFEMGNRIKTTLQANSYLFFRLRRMGLFGVYFRRSQCMKNMRPLSIHKAVKNQEGTTRWCFLLLNPAVRYPDLTVEFFVKREDPHVLQVTILLGRCQHLNFPPSNICYKKYPQYVYCCNGTRICRNHLKS